MKRSPLKRKTAMPRANRKRKRDTFASDYDSPEFVAFTQMSPSSATGERPPCVCSHSAKSRGAGGRPWHVVPLTEAEHEYEHRVGVVSAWKHWGKDPQAEADAHWQRWAAYKARYL